jgi:hypothetical protein
MAPTMFPCAYLRVFQPLEAFPPQERNHWERYIVEGGRARPVRPIYRERATVPQGGVGLLSSAEGDHADVRVVEGTYYVCPWRTRLRELASLLSLRDSTVPEMVDAFVPEAEARRAARELARLRRRSHAAMPFMLQSPWHVPIRWFVLVDQDERRLEEAAEGYRLTYRTTTAKGRRRAETALRALRRSELAPLSELVADLGRWLAAFEPRSLLELDYSGVAGMFTWDELDNDRSAGEIQEAISALASGDLARSAELYQAVAGRWAEVRSHESLN